MRKANQHDLKLYECDHNAITYLNGCRSARYEGIITAIIFGSRCFWPLRCISTGRTEYITAKIKSVVKASLLIQLTRIVERGVLSVQDMKHV